MKIGILTYHAAHNYGAVLQCYALQEYLKSRGHNVSIIDYRNSKILEVYKRFKWSRFIKKNPFIMIQRIVAELLLYNRRKFRYNAFEQFINSKLHLASVPEILNDPFDLIFVGSDQVWNFKLTYGFDPYYWGDFPRPSTTLLASYAASMQDNWNDSDSLIIESKLQNFDMISVRESSLADKLQQLIPLKKIYHVVDPTLLVHESIWDNIAIAPNINQPYLLFYQVDFNPLARKIAAEIAEKESLKLIVLSANIADENNHITISASPSSFVGLVKHAAMIVSSSFHATIFSIIFRKNFYAIKGKGKNARIMSLLSSLSLENRIIDSIPNSISSVDYSAVNSDSLRRESVDYINSVFNLYEKV